MSPEKSNQDQSDEDLKKREEAGQYYERFLRKEHPEYDEETLKQKVEDALNNPLFRRLIDLKQQFDQDVKEKHPDWDLDDL
jgi:hypothetical protein